MSKEQVKQVKEVVVPTYNKEELNLLPSVSAKIRFLDSKGLTRSQIKNELGLRHYQHVRNVLVTPLKKQVA